MYGFEFGGLDPNNNVAKRAIKSVLGTHLQELTPKIRQWAARGIESQLAAAAINGGDGKFFKDGPKLLSVMKLCIISDLPSTVSRTVNLTSFVRASVMHVNTQILFGNDLGAWKPERP